mmetsp:Transcript_106505/g.299287  ORF Transcript_106505/g.299287 Transcript_106505/m.299287 type:complete len:238 (-) Transcript_106505:799-1512(-)
MSSSASLSSKRRPSNDQHLSLCGSTSNNTRTMDKNASRGSAPLPSTSNARHARRTTGFSERISAQKLASMSFSNWREALLLSVRAPGKDSAKPRRNSNALISPVSVGFKWRMSMSSRYASKPSLAKIPTCPSCCRSSSRLTNPLPSTSHSKNRSNKFSPARNQLEASAPRGSNVQTAPAIAGKASRKNGSSGKDKEANSNSIATKNRLTGTTLPPPKAGRRISATRCAWRSLNPVII